MILVPIGSGKVGSCLVIFLMSNNFKIAIFSSGSGSNFEAIVKAKIPNVEVSFLFCNVEDAFVLERAKNLGIESIILSCTRGLSSSSSSAALSSVCQPL